MHIELSSEGRGCVESDNTCLPEALSGLWKSKDNKDDLLESKRGTEADPARSLYGKNAKPLDAVKAEFCVQPYGIGNCYFVAAMASYAQTNPQGIVDMIKDNKDGTYTVKFPGVPDEIRVSSPSKTELDQVGGLTEGGVWPVVLMKAYGKYCGSRNAQMEGADGGSLLSAGVKIFSRQGVSYLGIGYMLPLMSWKAMDVELQNALHPAKSADALPVTASTSKSLLSDKTVDGFVRGHVYSVLDYKHDRGNLRQSKVTLRNPHGGPDAVKTISLEQFYANFIQLSIPKK